MYVCTNLTSPSPLPHRTIIQYHTKNFQAGSNLVFFLQHPLDYDSHYNGTWQSNQNSSIFVNLEHKENPETTEHNLYFDSFLMPPWWPQHAKPNYPNKLEPKQIVRAHHQDTISTKQRLKVVMSPFFLLFFFFFLLGKLHGEKC